MKQIKKIVIAVMALVLALGCVACFASCGNNNNTTAQPIAIGVQAGTTGEAYVKGDIDWGFSGIPNSKASSYDTIGLAVNDIKNGSISYAVVDKAVAENLVATNPNDIKMIDIDLTVEKYAIGVDKENKQLLDDINGVLATIKGNGTLADIYAAYAGIEGEQGVAPESTVYVGVEQGDNTATKKLVLATNAQFAPYEYKIGEKFYGIDMEIAKIIATELGYELIISDMEFSAVVTSVQQGTADIAIACLTVNAKREKSVTFTNAYEEGAAQVLIVKKNDTAFDACKTADDVMNVFNSMK